MGQRNRLLTDVGETAAGIDYALGCFFGLGHRGTGFDLSCADGGNVLDVLVLVVSIEGGGKSLHGQVPGKDGLNIPEVPLL